MSGSYRITIGILFCLLGANICFGDETLSKKIRTIIDGPDYGSAHWGLLIVDTKTGATVFEQNPDQIFTPASTTKLFSCATALCTLGPDYRFETPIYQRGTVQDGILKGDLILVASGDLSFGSRVGKDGKTAFTNSDHTYANSGSGTAQLTDTNPLFALESLADQIVQAGIKDVRGAILIDDRLFDRSRSSGSGPDTISPMLMNDNVIDLIIAPGEKEGDPAKVTIRPETRFLTIDLSITTGKKTSPSQITIQQPSSHLVTVRGSVPMEAKPTVRIIPIDEPSKLARTLFIEVLRRKGVKVQAPLIAEANNNLPSKSEYANWKKVAVYQSAPLSEAITVTLKVSHNLYASTLPLLVAAKHGERTLNQGLKRQAQFLKSLDVEVEKISFAGGAGGMNADAITPRAAVQLLQAMSKRPEAEAYFQALPLLGIDGTLHDVVAADSPAKGKVQAKTGTLSWHDALNDRTILRSKALAGQMTTAKDTKLFFAMFVNDVLLPKGVSSSREGKVLGKICEVVYQYGP